MPDHATAVRWALPRAIWTGAEFHDPPNGIAASLGTAECAAVVSEFDALTAERDRLATELARFMPEPMSQVCRDGLHGGKCSNCRCLCHTEQAERMRLDGQVRQWQVIAEGAAQALADLLALPGVRESQLRAGAAEIARIRRSAIDALNGGMS